MNDEKRRRDIFNGYVKARDKAMLAMDSLLLLYIDKDVLNFNEPERDALCSMLGRALIKEGEATEMLEQAKERWGLDE